MDNTTVWENEVSASRHVMPPDCKKKFCQLFFPKSLVHKKPLPSTVDATSVPWKMAVADLAFDIPDLPTAEFTPPEAGTIIVISPEASVVYVIATPMLVIGRSTPPKAHSDKSGAPERVGVGGRSGCHRHSRGWRGHRRSSHACQQQIRRSWGHNHRRCYSQGCQTDKKNEAIELREKEKKEQMSRGRGVSFDFNIALRSMVDLCDWIDSKPPTGKIGLFWRADLLRQP